MKSRYDKQQDEIKTIKERTLTLQLSDADVKRLCKKAASVSLTVPQLLENFIGDLVCGTYSNGSDERDYVHNWFERCCFDFSAEPTFLRYSLMNFICEDVIELYTDIQDEKEYLSEIESESMEEDELEEKTAVEENIEVPVSRLFEFR